MTNVGDAAELPLPDRGPNIGQVVAARELLRLVRERLSADERRLVEERAAGRPWAEMAAETHATAEGLRKRHARALDRVLKELGLDADEIV
jgi:hypothetical protein